MNKIRLCVMLASTVVLGSAGVLSMAQPPGGQGRGQGRGQGGGQGGGFGRRGGGPLTVASVPVEALAKPLSLTADQKTKITGIQAKYREDMRALFPQGGRGGPGGGRPGGGPGANARPGGAPGGPGGGAPVGGVRPGGGRGFGGMDPAVMEKIRGLSQTATASIEGVLKSSQKAKLPGLLKEFQALREARIPLEVASDLKLTPDQAKRIEAVSDEQQKKMQAMFQGAARGGDRNAMRASFQAMRQENQQKIDAILTADQKAAIKKYEDAHPRPGRGGGGPGGGRGGRGGGAPGIS